MRKLSTGGKNHSNSFLNRIDAIVISNINVRLSQAVLAFGIIFLVNKDAIEIPSIEKDI